MISEDIRFCSVKKCTAASRTQRGKHMPSREKDGVSDLQSMHMIILKHWQSPNLSQTLSHIRCKSHSEKLLLWVSKWSNDAYKKFSLLLGKQPPTGCPTLPQGVSCQSSDETPRFQLYSDSFLSMKCRPKLRNGTMLQTGILNISIQYTQIKSERRDCPFRNFLDCALNHTNKMSNSPQLVS